MSPISFETGIQEQEQVVVYDAVFLRVLSVTGKVAGD